jgi:predicted metal-dependent peptidase
MLDTQAIRVELEDLKALLFLRTPYLALLLSKMRISVSEGVRTVLATPSGETIVNPEFWGKLRNRETKTFVLVHEALHLAFRHPWTAQGRDRALFNVAADRTWWSTKCSSGTAITRPPATR